MKNPNYLLVVRKIERLMWVERVGGVGVIYWVGFAVQSTEKKIEKKGFKRSNCLNPNPKPNSEHN